MTHLAILSYNPCLSFKMAIEYETLTPDEFDAVVTGELTHYAILFENRINDFLVSYLGILKSRLIYSNGSSYTEMICDFKTRLK